MTSDPVERYLLKAARQGRRARLRPLQLAELFDLSLRIYRTLGWSILGMNLIPTIFTLAGLSFLFFYVMPSFGSTSQGASDVKQVFDATLNFGLGVFIALPLTLAGVALSTTYVAPLVSDFMLGNVPNAKAAREAQWRAAPKMLAISLREAVIASSGAIVAGILLLGSWWLSRITTESDATAGLVLVAGVFALCGGAIVTLYVISAHALVAPVAVLENLGATAAAKRSKQLLKARPPHASGYDAVWTLYLLLGLIVLSLGSGAAVLTGIIGLENWTAWLGQHMARPIVEGALALIPAFVVLWILVPVWAVSVTMIYFERRVRLEGYDIEALAADVWRSDREGRFLL